MGRHAAYIVAVGNDVASASARQETPRPTVVLLPWGDVFEDFLDRLGVSFEELRDEFVGSWMFGYAAALATAGVRTVIVCPTSHVTEPVAAVHVPTGAGLRLLPTSRAHASLRAQRLDGRLDGRRDPRAVARAAATHVAPYLGTPPRALARLLRQESASALLCQEYEDPRFDVCVAVGRLSGVPVFGTFQGADYQVSRLERPLRPLSIRASAGLVVGARRELERVERTYGVPAEKLAHIANPIDAETWRPDDGATARAELGIPADSLGRRLARADAAPAEGPRRPARRVAEADRRRVRPTATRHLVLVGSGEDADEVRRRVSTLSLPGVHVVDEWVQDRARMRSILSAADVYAFPSRHEGLPVSPLEAMACGVPVVGADATGVADVVGDAGVVVPRDDRGSARRSDRRAPVRRRATSGARSPRAGSRAGALLAGGCRERSFARSSSTGTSRDAESRTSSPRTSSRRSSSVSCGGSTARVSRSRCTSTARRARATWDEMVARCRDLDVTWLPRHRSQWGGFGHVRATLKGIDHFVGSEVPFDYAVLLTGQDYPLRPPAEIARFLGESGGRSYMRHVALPWEPWGSRGGLDRIEDWHVITYRRLHLALPLRRRLPGGLEPYGGSAYWCLSSTLVHFVHGFLSENPDYVRFFEHVFVPDEIFFQTIIMNSELRDTVENDDLRYLDWSREPAPAVLTLRRPARARRRSSALRAEVRRDRGHRDPRRARSPPRHA